MAQIEAAPGVRVSIPDDVELRVVRDGPSRRGLSSGTPSGIAGTVVLKSTLSDAGFRHLAEIEIVPSRRKIRPLRRGSGIGPEIEVNVRAGESALVLVEGAGGVYAWCYPSGNVLTARRRATNRTLVFPLAPTIAPARSAGSGRRGVVLDWIVDTLFEPVRAYVLKFAVGAVIDVSVDYLEGDKVEGLTTLSGDDPARWKPGQDLPSHPLDRPARVLMMIHGTFSSTANAFGPLTASETGRRFLTKVHTDYDAVIGFDHKTLRIDPKTNARALMDALEKLKLPQHSVIDVVAHSRGGLVYRCLAEELLEARRPDIKLGKAIFIACTNAGTHLAEPANWAATVDLYTNAIMAGARFISALAGTPALNPLVVEGIKTLGRFVQMLSEVAIKERRVPGLAEMQPGSKTIRELNGREGGLERLAEYYAVTSNFAPRVSLRKGITKEFVSFVADRVTDRLFQADNDLVVDTESMTTFGTRGERLGAERTFALGDSANVYHTVYFATDQVQRRLTDWLNGKAAVEHAGDNFVSDRNLAISMESFDGLSALEGSSRRSTPARRKVAGSSSAQSGKSSRPRQRAKNKQLAAPADLGEAACHFAAEMEPYPALKSPVALFVTISREAIEGAVHAAAARSSLPVPVDSSHAIVVQVVGRRNCKVLSPATAVVSVPAEGRPSMARFTVQGAEEGAANLLVEVLQGAQLLASFTLAPVFVGDQKSLRVSQSAPMSMTTGALEEPAVLRIYEIVEGGRITLRFDLSCQAPNISVSETRTLPSGFSRDAYVTENFKDIESAWLTSGRIHDQFLLRLKANGITMANELLPDKVRAALWRHRDAIRAIQVISEEPFIPWELLYITDPKAGPEGRGFLSEWGLVRWLHNTSWPGRHLSLSAERVRYIIPTYVDPSLRLEGAAEDGEMIRKLFAKAQPVDAKTLEVANFLYKTADNCDLVHFACHGEAAQRAVMRADLLMTGERTDGGFAMDLLSADIVKTHVRFAETGPRPIVFVNACQTGRAGSGLAMGVAGFVDGFLRPSSERGAGAFIGALWSVDDKLATVFARSFYGSLLGGKSLVESARAAREAAKSEQDFTWLAYTVYGNPFARVS